MAKFHVLQPRQCHVLQHRHSAGQIAGQLSGTAAAKEALKQRWAASQYLSGTQGVESPRDSGLAKEIVDLVILVTPWYSKVTELVKITVYSY